MRGSRGLARVSFTRTFVMRYRLAATIIKLVVASLIVGTVLDHFDITAARILGEAGVTPERVLERAQAAFAWAGPNLMLGALVIVPLWLLMALLRPPAPAERDYD
jgi:hypothetical protein